jgi:hypothetical protein
MTLSGLAALALMVASVPVVAHHGTAGSYDENRVVKLTGIIKEFRWRNPHSALFIEARDESGKLVTYALEMGSPNTLARLGYSRTTFKPGDAVVMEMHPSFTNPANGYSPASLPVVINGQPFKPVARARPQ